MEEGCLYHLKDLVEGDSSFELLNRIRLDSDREILHATIDKDINIKLYMHRLASVNADLLLTMNRQSSSDPLSFEHIAGSLAIEDWTLFK